MPAVNPEILVWARATAGLTLQEAAARVRIRDARGVAAVDRLAALERGDDEPTRPILVRSVVDEQGSQNPRRQARAGRQDASPRKGAVAGDEACSTCSTPTSSSTPTVTTTFFARVPEFWDWLVDRGTRRRVTVQSDSAWVAR